MVINPNKAIESTMRPIVEDNLVSLSITSRETISRLSMVANMLDSYMDPLYAIPYVSKPNLLAPVIIGNIRNNVLDIKSRINKANASDRNEHTSHSR